MGIPKFYRYSSERYCCLNEFVTEHQIPEFDNFYLDMNGIIHTCSHPNDGDPHFRISELEIFQNIRDYLEYLVATVKPKKVLFLAVDGVAPRAKMNQQRGRRFRSAKEAETLEEIARKKGEVLPLEKRFDSNCITPGTRFMEKLHRQLRYFISMKQSTDKLWQKPSVILSGHETPGEGEHKIMDYIRYIKSKPDYDPNTRHCLYGLDADLIMLGLCTHEPNFSLLREEVTFSKKQQKRTACAAETRFYLLHLSILRDYLKLEFIELHDTLPFLFDLECIINDWVLMCFLVGNDFIPNLPGLHINTGALPSMMEAYIQVLPQLNGYINEYGNLNLTRFETFMKRLSDLDFENFKETCADLQYFHSKASHVEEEEEEPTVINGDLAALINRTDEFLDDEEDGLSGIETLEDSADESTYELLHEFQQHKRDYYMNKLNYPQVTKEVLQEQATCYVRAIQWNLHYYYHGCCSWSWYYPHHYAPFISDIRNFTDLDIIFEAGKPFLPFEQLLAVLPAASKELLPEPYHRLMTSLISPILQYYPTNFETDLNGKKQEWEAVVLIPFIDETLLLQAMEACNGQLTLEEKLRNSHGPMLQFDYIAWTLGKIEPTEFFHFAPSSHSIITPIDRNTILIPREQIVQGLCHGFDPQMYIPGFYTLRHIPHTASVVAHKVKVFERPSQNDSMLLKLLPHEESVWSLHEAADKLLGTTVYVNYPHIQEARVMAVCDALQHIAFNPTTGGVTIQDVDKNNNLFIPAKNKSTENYSSRLAIDIGETRVMVFAQPIIGRKYIITHSGQVTLEKQWDKSAQGYPLQTIITRLKTPLPDFTHFNTVGEIFSKNSLCFLVECPDYGARCKVVQGEQGTTLLVKLYEPSFPPIETVNQSLGVMRNIYMTSHTAAQMLHMTTTYFGYLTGCIFVVYNRSEEHKRYNIALSLKFNSRNEEVPGYTKRINGNWMYSMQTVELVKLYARNFPSVFNNMARKFSYNSNSGKVHLREDQVFPIEAQDENHPENIHALVSWLKKLPCTKIERQKCGSETMEVAQVRMLEDILVAWKPASTKTCLVQLDARALYKPGAVFGNLLPDADATYQLCDRVVNIKDNYAVPLALHGTVIGIQNADQLIDVMFDEPFSGGMLQLASSPCCYRMNRASLINISHGKRKEIALAKDGKHLCSVFIDCPRTDSGGDSDDEIEEGQYFSRDNFVDVTEDDVDDPSALAYLHCIQRNKQTELELLKQLYIIQSEPLSLQALEHLMRHKQRLQPLINSNTHRMMRWAALKEQVHKSPLRDKMSMIEHMFKLNTPTLRRAKKEIANEIPLEIQEKRKETQWWRACLYMLYKEQHLHQLVDQAFCEKNEISEEEGKNTV